MAAARGWLDGFELCRLAVHMRRPLGAGALHHLSRLEALPVLARSWKTGAVTGVLSGAAYWIVMWAMTKAPIASVAALRETSILFAMTISVFALREALTPWRVVAARADRGGVFALRLG